MKDAHEERRRLDRLKTAISEHIIQHVADKLDMTVSEYGSVYDSTEYENLLNRIMREVVSSECKAMTREEQRSKT